MKPQFLALLALFLLNGNAAASLYGYPEGARPDVSLAEATEISETLVGKLVEGKGYYIYDVSLYGDEKQSGAGTWNLMFRNARGDMVQVAVYFPEDFCIVIAIPKDGEATEKGVARDGRVSPKWLEWQEKDRREEEENEDPFGTVELPEAEAAPDADDPFDGGGKARILTDPGDLALRDRCIARWYVAQAFVVEELKSDTGHKFGPVWNRRSPVEILEELLAFMREFQAESERLEALERNAPDADADAP